MKSLKFLVTPKQMIGRVLALLVCLTATQTLPALAQPPQAPNAVTVSLVPNSTSVSDCTPQTITIYINDVTNLYALDIRLTFDPNLIQIVSLTPVSTWFVTGYTVRNEINNYLGTIWYAVTQTYPTSPANGTGPIATLTVQARNPGTTSLAFSYIKLSDPNGLEIPASGVNGSVTSTGAPVPPLSIIRSSTTDITLNWTAQTGVSGYQVYRSTTPYQNGSLLASPVTNSYTNAGVLGNPTTNYFYVVRSICTTGGTTAFSNQVGKFEYRLYDTATTDYNWIAIPLQNSSITNASTLKTHIQTNNNNPVTILAVSRWNAGAQGYTSWGGFGPPFNVFTGFPYQVQVDVITGTNTVWALVGNVPPIQYDKYTLLETSTTDFTWIMQPLFLSGITSASGLANDIQLNASQPNGPLSISQWNNSGQNMTTYNRVSGIGNFGTRFGYPYMVQIDVYNGTSTTWP